MAEAVRGQVRSFIEQLLGEELKVALGRGRYQRGAGSTAAAMGIGRANWSPLSAR